jgi:hypothetical protein
MLDVIDSTKLKLRSGIFRLYPILNKLNFSHVSEVAHLRRLLGLVPQTISDRNLFLPVVAKIEDMLDMMESSDLVDIFKELSFRLYRDKDLLTQIIEQLIRL